MAIRATAKERGKEELRRMAKETGGVAFEVKNGQTLQSIYTENPRRTAESIQYRQYAGTACGRRKYHKIKLVTKDRHLIVNTRDGYFAK